MKPLPAWKSLLKGKSSKSLLGAPKGEVFAARVPSIPPYPTGMQRNLIYGSKISMQNLATNEIERLRD